VIRTILILYLDKQPKQCNRKSAHFLTYNACISKSN